jgi:hypothetical protein
MKRDRALHHASRIPLSLPLFRGRAPRVWHLGNATADERCGRSIRAPEAGGGGLKATAITRPPSPLPSWDARGIGNGECHQLPLRDSSGISPDSMRSQRVIARSMDGRRDPSRQFPVVGIIQHQNPAVGCGKASNFQKITAKTPRTPRKIRVFRQQIHLGALGVLAVNPQGILEDNLI